MRLAFLAVCFFALGVLVRDVAQDYMPTKVAQAKECQCAKDGGYLIAIAQADEVGDKVNDRRRLSDTQILALLGYQFADVNRSPVFESELLDEITAVQRRIARKCAAREDKI